MPTQGLLTFILLCMAALISTPASGHWRDLPPLPPSEQYGNVLINRLSGKYGQPWVSFSHWSHRIKYTCRVCHLELGFEMKVNATEISEEKNRKGEFCGACHNGKIAFAHTKENCAKCHNGNVSYSDDKFKSLVHLPGTQFGNRIDWTNAREQELIKPQQSIFQENYAPVPYKEILYLEDDAVNMPVAVFSHPVHTQWLDCANCHPDIFNIKKETTQRLTMEYIIEGKFCGVCHMTVAFPLNDCMRCHVPRGK